MSYRVLALVLCVGLAGATTGQIAGPAAMNPELPERTRYLVARVTSALPARATK